MLRSIEEVSIQLGVSKTSIYNKLKFKIYKDKIVKKQGKLMVDEELFNLIKDSFKVEKRKNVNSVKKEIAMDRDDILNLNHMLNIELIEQLKEKDKQIERLQKLLDNSQKLVENNQVLLKQQQDKDITSKLLEEHFKELDCKIIDIKDKMEKRKSHRSVFNIFKRERDKIKNIIYKKRM